MLYLQALRAIYGSIYYALLWFDLFSNTLTEKGFKLNEYNRCVANKEINRKQCTISWYIDDNILTHVDPEVVTAVTEDLKGHFGELKVSRGKTHKFFGMQLTVDKNVRVLMKDQLIEACKAFPEDLCGQAATPVHLGFFHNNEIGNHYLQRRKKFFIPL